MRTIRTKIYKFDELLVDNQQNAIEAVRNQYYDHNDFSSWALDDCSLFEPEQAVLLSLFGENYNFPLIKNTRENIYFDTDRNRFLDCSQAMDVTNDEHFLLWLGIDRNVEGLGDITFTIFSFNNYSSNAKIDFDDYSSDFDELIISAQKKFDKHIESILKRIEADIDYRFTDEAIIEGINSNDYEFFKNGKIYNN